MFPNMEEEEKEGDNDEISFFNDLIFYNTEEEEKEVDDNKVGFWTDLIFS